MEDKKEKARDKLIADCFGNVAGGKHCHILTEDMCLYGKCPFYKTRAQFDADRERYSKMSSANMRAVFGKKVMCVENKKVYLTIRSAAEDLGISASAVSMVLRGKQKSTHGLTFRYL